MGLGQNSLARRLVEVLRSIRNLKCLVKGHKERANVKKKNKSCLRCGEVLQ